MQDIRTVHLKILQGRLDEIAYEVTQLQFRAGVGQAPWQPPINVYRCRERIVIVVELAGVNRADIELQVEPYRVRLAGSRRIPALPPEQGPLQQVIALEIDDGRFDREILLPAEVVAAETRAELRNGLLWIDLPLLSPRSA